MSDSTVKYVSSKFHINDQSIIQKASEYLRLLQMKSTITNMSDILKISICLDLASSYLGLSFDRTLANSLNNLTNSSYQCNYNVIEKMLGLSRNISIREICVQLGCTSVMKTAVKLFNQYKNSDKVGRNFDHPQYIMAAVYTACQLKQIKIKKAEVLSLSKIKPKQMKELEVDFMKFAEANGFKEENNMKTKKRKGNELIEQIEAHADNFAIENETKNVAVHKIESYDDWRNRILEEAYTALKLK